MPSEHLITKEMRDTGYSRLVCIRRINARKELQRRQRYTCIGWFDRSVTELTEVHEQHKQGIAAALERIDRFLAGGEAR